MLRTTLEKDYKSSIEVVGEADDVDSGVYIIEKLKPDLVFLDINMTTGTGFDLLDKIENPDFEVVFITAYNNYAVKAFQFSAFGYILKPIRPKELSSVVERMEDYQKLSRRSLEKRLKVLVENYGGDRVIKKLVISNQRGFQISTIENIIRLEGDGNYTNFIFEGGAREMTSKSLGDYEELLNDHGFFRIHQSTIVNLRHVVGYSKESGDKVEMSDGESFSLSRYRKPEFLKRFM